MRLRLRGSLESRFQYSYSIYCIRSSTSTCTNASPSETASALSIDACTSSLALTVRVFIRLYICRIAIGKNWSDFV